MDERTLSSVAHLPTGRVSLRAGGGGGGASLWFQDCSLVTRRVSPERDGISLHASSCVGEDPPSELVLLCAVQFETESPPGKESRDCQKAHRPPENILKSNLLVGVGTRGGEAQLLRTGASPASLSAPPHPQPCLR